MVAGRPVRGLNAEGPSVTSIWEPTKMSLEIVQQVRTNFPTPLGDAHPSFLANLVSALGPAWGLLRKSGGTRINVGGVDVSQDVLTDRAGIQVDVLVDGEGEARPCW